MDLTNKEILVAGGARRVGQAIALALSKEGALVNITYHTSWEDARSTRTFLRERTPESEAYRCNFTQVSDIQKLFSAFEKDHGRLYAYVHTSAIFEKVDFFEISEEKWNLMINTNLKGAFFASQCAARLMEKNHTPSQIIHFTDSTIGRPRSNYIHYTISKAGVENLVYGLARRLRPNIRVNGIAPGPVLLPENYTKGERESVRKRTLLGKIGSPEDVANAVIYILEQGDFLTGEIIRVDGGSYLS